MEKITEYIITLDLQCMEQQGKLSRKFVLALKTDRKVFCQHSSWETVSSNDQTNFSKIKISAKFLV